jgi:hypothetical protein
MIQRTGTTWLITKPERTGVECFMTYNCYAVVCVGDEGKVVSYHR